MECERFRQEESWDRILDSTITKKNGSVDAMNLFYATEATLERLIETEGSMDELPEPVQKSLVDLKARFDSLLKTKLPPEYARLTRLLLAKIYYLLDDTKECELCLDKADLDRMDFVNESNRRNLKLFAEALCIRALCRARNLAANSRSFRRADRAENLIMEDFEAACDATLRYCQLMEHTSGDSSPLNLGDLLETALVRAPVLYARFGQLSNGLSRIRETLRAVQTVSLRTVRFKLADQLLEILLRGFLGAHYIDPRVTERLEPAGVQGRRPKRYAAAGSFIPVIPLEEIYLLCFICEAVLARELSLRAPGDIFQNKSLAEHSTKFADLFAIAFNRIHELHLSIPFLERAAKSCTHSVHLWTQFALTLTLRGESSKAIKAFNHCYRLDDTNRGLFAFAAKVAIERLGDLDLAEHFLRRLERWTENWRVRNRSKLMLAVVFSLKAQRATELKRQLELRAYAIKLLLQTEAEDNDDFLVYYHLGLEHCVKREIHSGVQFVKKSLRLNMDFLPSHHLLALILSSWKKYDQALKVLEGAEPEFDEDFEMELTKIKLISIVRGPEEALKFCKLLLALWKRSNELDYDRDRAVTMTPDNLPTSPSVFPIPSPVPALMVRDGTLTAIQTKVSPSSPMVNGDTASYRTESAGTMGRLDGNMSEMASTSGSCIVRNVVSGSSIVQLNVWIVMAELYLELEQYENALECLGEAASIGLASHLIHHLQGVISLRCGMKQEAFRHFDNALALRPCHAATHMELGKLYRNDNFVGEAETHFRAALQGDQSCFEAWAALGELYLLKKNDEMATHYLDKARALESSQPVRSFAHLPRCISF